VWFWVATLVVTVLWALGGSTPFYHLVYAIVPGTKYFRAPSTILYIVAFSVAVLAALGTERAVRGLVSTRYLAAWAVFGTLVAVLASTGALTNIATSIAAPELYERVLANGGSLTLGAWRSLAFVLATAALISAATRGRLSHVALGWALAAIVASDFWTVLRLYWRFSPPAAVLYASDPTVEYLKHQREPGRVLALPLSRDVAPHDPTLSGDGLMVHDVRQVLGYHGNELGRYQVMYSGEGSLANPNFWQLYNVRHLLTNTEQVPIDGAVRVAGPAKDAAGTTVYLFQLPGENPAAWVAPAMVKAPDEAALATVLDPRFPIRSTAIFDTSANVVARTDLQRPPAPLSIRADVAEYRPGHITVNLDAPAPGGSALVVSENYFPGWHALVEGQPVAASRADYTLIGVPLPAGARRVELTFVDPAYERGKVVTLVALGLAFLAIGAGAALDRRRRG
jgi:hypothetical protein